MAKRKDHDLSYNYGKTAPEQNPFESDTAYFKRLAKMADERLVRLEKLAQNPDFENVTKYAYANAMYDIKALTHDNDARRFNRVGLKTQAGELDKRSLNARINAVKRFLDAPTSTKSGIVKSYKNRANTLNERYGTDFTWQEMQSYFERRKNKLKDSEYGSKTELKAYGAIRRQGNNIAAIKQAVSEGKTVRLANDDMVNETAIEMIKNNEI